ncbi:DNA repair protein XRCC2 homolog isoform X4 [Diospyros lotus]|uniref:DNA repair protein XRCC2 homolog isoform X4 n=1 Tax=Diospyros lotus TaxID=55363 RepID=UPI002255784B|nr:DNA repair protein XRCC2 homolog isoform X4 [Diospyros lotus]
MEEEVERWVQAEESAKAMLGRVFKERPLLLLRPPFHRVPLRPGNVVEVVGPSPSAKTHILIQAAISCILPREWNGVNYGGLEKLVMFIDLDCRFDILCLSQSLKHRMMEVSGKTLHFRLQEERERHGIDVHFLMIDSIGAFHWIDRASTSLAVMDSSRKSHSLQCVSQTIVREIRKLLLVHPMLILVTKTASLGDKYSTTEANRNSGQWSSENTTDGRATRTRRGPQILAYREYMPSVWQSFVTHRVLVRASDDGSQHQNCPIYLSEWLLPSLNILDKFIVTDAGVSPIS